MHIKTTINISQSLLDNIIEASSITGMTKNDIILILIKRISELNGGCIPSNNLRFASPVKYQQKEKNRNQWCKLHVKLPGGDYEYLLDVKKIFKLSVSFLIAISLKKYLSEIIKAVLRKENMDSYRCSAYAIAFEMVDDVVCWKLYWGIPQTLTG